MPSPLFVPKKDGQRGEQDQTCAKRNTRALTTNSFATYSQNEFMSIPLILMHFKVPNMGSVKRRMAATSTSSGTHIRESPYSNCRRDNIEGSHYLGGGHVCCSGKSRTRSDICTRKEPSPTLHEKPSNSVSPHRDFRRLHFSHPFFLPFLIQPHCPSFLFAENSALISKAHGTSTLLSHPTQHHQTSQIHSLYRRTIERPWYMTPPPHICPSSSNYVIVRLYISQRWPSPPFGNSNMFSLLYPVNIEYSRCCVTSKTGQMLQPERKIRVKYLQYATAKSILLFRAP